MPPCSPTGPPITIGSSEFRSWVGSAAALFAQEVTDLGEEIDVGERRGLRLDAAFAAFLELLQRQDDEEVHHRRDEDEVDRRRDDRGEVDVGVLLPP